MTNLTDKKQKLNEFIEELVKEDVFLAFSGGIDSSLILKLLCQKAEISGKKVYAVTFHTFLHPIGDLQVAKRVAEEFGANHVILQINELDNKEILKNPVDRCYLCKKYLFEKLITYATDKNVKTIIEGTNADDLKVYRPGLRAIKELKINSPLAVCEFTKNEVRTYAQELNISVAHRPSNPCMATRLPYNTPITIEKMQQIDKGEEYLRELGFKNVRLRIHNEVVRIEVDKEDLEKAISLSNLIVTKMKNIGLHYITLDLEGFRQGSMDELLNKE